MHYLYCKCIIIQLITFYAPNCFTLQCKDERNNPVDWFYMYKLPQQKDNLNSLLSDGVAYMYITASEMNNGWILSNFSIQDPMSMLGRTLAPLYKDENIVSLLYNDQPPHNQYISEIIKYIPLYQGNIRGKDGNDGKKHDESRNEYYYKYDLEEKGHTKGVVLGDTLTSFWLVHSIPKFPPAPIGNTGYQYPNTGRKYGQTLLCMSVRTPILDQIAVQLKYNEPLVFYHSVPDDLVKSLPNLVDVTQNKTVNISPWYHTQSFETLNGSTYLSFAKSANFRDDLYSGLVAQSLNSDLLVESWINGPSILDSDCARKYQVHNIEELVFPHNFLSFTSHDDHSKWAIATHRNITERNGFTLSKFWICVGDINRALSQETRGGGTVCTLNQDIWKNFAQLVNLVQQCKV